LPVKNDSDVDPRPILIMQQFLDQCLAREVRSPGMQVTQLGPRENDAMTIDDKISCRHSIL